jgi:hypothetical protein
VHSCVCVCVCLPNTVALSMSRASGTSMGYLGTCTFFVKVCADIISVFEAPHVSKASASNRGHTACAWCALLAVAAFDCASDMLALTVLSC